MTRGAGGPSSRPVSLSDSTRTNREFWKDEMGKALRDIQEAYNQRMDEIQSEQESYYNSKV